MPIGKLRLLGRDQIISLGILFLGLLGFAIYQETTLDFAQRVASNVINRASQQKAQFATLQMQYEDQLFQEHLDVLDRQSLELAKKQIEDEYAAFKSDENQAKLAKIDAVYQSYKDTLTKIDRNNALKINTDAIAKMIPDWGIAFLAQDYDKLGNDIKAAQSQLDNEYSTYLASLPTPTPKPTTKPVTPVPAAKPAEGYSYQVVGTSRGNFYAHVIKLSLGQIQVKTVTANSDNCTDNCPAKSLASYVQENNGYAGINGSYFCPPDYSSCAGKVNSYDFAVYNTNLSKWINQHSLAWNNIGLAAFNGSAPQFYKESKNYSGGAITAGIANFPSLLENGNVVVDGNQLSSYQRDVKGVRGAIGTDGQNVYLSIMSSATVIDAAYIMQSLGARDALNLDGGGSSALYINGAYKVGPGRSLPNAVVIVK